MEARPAAEMARRHRDTIVGIKTAHYQGPEWTPVERAVEAGTLAGRAGDGGLRQGPSRAATRGPGPAQAAAGRHLHAPVLRHSGASSWRAAPNPALAQARDRGVIFDVGHGAGSFRWRMAVPIVKAGFLPDSISTDLHVASMNAGMKDMLNVMSKFLALGMPLPEVDRAVDLEPRQADPAGDARTPLGRRSGRRRRAARRARAFRLCRHGWRANGGIRTAGVRGDRARRRGRLRPQRSERYRVGPHARGPEREMITGDQKVRRFITGDQKIRSFLCTEIALLVS